MTELESSALKQAVHISESLEDLFARVAVTVSMALDNDTLSKQICAYLDSYLGEKLTKLETKESDLEKIKYDLISCIYDIVSMAKPEEIVNKPKLTLV